MSLSANELALVRTLDERSVAFYNAETQRVQKSAGVAYLLLFFFGWLGVHKFYLGSRRGYLYLAAASCIWLYLARLIRAVSSGARAGSGDGLFLLLAIISGVGLVIGLVFDLFTLPSQTDEANYRLRMAILRQLESLSAPVGDETEG
jgi:TM2 domain-containing membrane protein YozV